MSQLNPYGIKDGVRYYIYDYRPDQKYLLKGCMCPACREPLIPRMGDINAFHFAHKSGSDCNWGYETALHQMAKEILEEKKEILLPAHIIVFHRIIEKRRFEKKRQTFQKVTLEKKLFDIRPDVILETKTGKKMIVEIGVTHFIDQKKLNKIKKLNIGALEVNLKDLKNEIVTKEKLTQILLFEDRYKEWKYVPGDEEFIKNEQSKVFRDRVVKKNHYEYKPPSPEELNKNKKEREKDYYMNYLEKNGYDNNKLEVYLREPKWKVIDNEGLQVEKSIIENCPLKKRNAQPNNNLHIPFALYADCRYCKHAKILEEDPKFVLCLAST